MTKLTLTFFLLLSYCGFGQTTFDTKTFGQKILKGQVNYNGKNESDFFKTLDSLFCKSKADKLFYFKTTNKIFQISDGALSEYCSGIANRYYFELTLEFITNSKSLSQQDLDRWLMHIAFESAANADGFADLPKIKKQLDNLVSDCKCDVTKADSIRKYNAILYKKIEQNIKDNAG